MMAITKGSFSWTMRGPGQLRRRVLQLCLLVACGHAVAAQPLLYTLEIPDDRAVTFEVPLEVRHPGLLTIRAEWDGTRQIALRVDRTDLPVAVARASGPSPLELTIEVSPDSTSKVDWKLAIHAVAARGGGAGLLTIELPPPPGSERPEEEPAPLSPAAPPTDPEPWMEPRPAPPGAPADHVRVYDAGERYRALLSEPSEEPQPDSCRWQDDLMRYLSGRLDALAQGGAPPEAATGRLLARIADAVDTVEALRTSSDPLVAGPPPEERERRELWLRLRREEFHDVEGELDALAEQVMRGHAPELVDQTWALRMVICLTACERHFEARGRVGEEQATNRDLARNQWERLRAAAEALRALAGVVGSG